MGGAFYYYEEAGGGWSDRYYATEENYNKVTLGQWWIFPPRTTGNGSRALRVNVFNASQYTHNWKFAGWSKSDTGTNGPNRKTTVEQCSPPSTQLVYNQEYAPDSKVTVWWYGDEYWHFYFTISSKTGTTFTINYNGNGGSTPGATSAQYPNKVSIAAAPSYANYIFQGWNSNTANNGNAYNPSTTIDHPGAGSMTIYAIWLGVLYTFIYNKNDTGASGTTNDTSARYNSDITIAACGFAKTGYVFSHWNSQSNNLGTTRTPGSISHPGSGSSTLYAQWKAAVYKLSYSGNTGTGTAPGNTELIYDSANTVAANTFAKTGWTFRFWQINNASGQKVTDVNESSSTIIWVDTTAPYTAQAQWRQNTFTLRYNGNQNTSGSTENTVSLYNTSATVASNGFSRSGYFFAGWSTSSSGSVEYQPGASIAHPTAETLTDLYAIWTGWQYTLSYNMNTSVGGGGSTNSTSARYPTAVTVANNGFTKTGYSFAGWATSASNPVSYSGGTTYANPVGTNNGSAILYAKWNAVTYTVSYNVNAIVGDITSGSISNSSPTYDSSFTFSANSFTKTGYTFREWNLREGTTLTGTNIGNYAANFNYGNWNRTENCTAFALWNANTYTITYNGNSIDPTGNVTGTTATSSFLFDSTFTFPANGFTLIGFTFSGWNLKRAGVPVGGLYNAGASYGVWKIPENCTADAQWTINSYQITFNRNGQGVGKSVTQNYKTQVICPTLKAVGYVFGGWATSVQNATNKIVNKLGGDTFILGAADENYFAIWTDNANNTVRFSELETVFGGTNPISISEYRTQSGQTTAGSIITVSTHFKGKGVAPP